MEWWIWLVLGVGIGIVELSSVTFVLLWFAIAAVVTAALAPVVHSLWVQSLIFAVLSLGMYFASRPLAKKWRRTRTFSTHLETRVGHTGVVVSGAEPGGFATVRIEGELWSATCTEPLRAGASVIVKDAEGAILKVAPAPDHRG